MEHRQTSDVLAAVRNGCATVEAIQERTSLHPNTIRTQLQHLIDDGLVVRTAAPATGRGRPRAHFAPTPAMTASPAQDPWVGALTATTTRLLMSGYGQVEVPDSAAAARLGAELAGELPPMTDTTSPTSSQADLCDLLTRFGFDPVSTGAQITLHQCPVLEVAQQLPHLTCTLHEGLAQRRLDDTGRHWQARLQPFGASGRCVLHLTPTQPEQPGVTRDPS